MAQDRIKNLRLKKQVELIQSKFEFTLNDHPSGGKQIVFIMQYTKTNSIPLMINIPPQYPFHEPSYTFQPPEGFLSKNRSAFQRPISELLGEWNPGMRLSNIAENAIKEIEKTLVHKSVVRTDWMYESVGENSKLIWLVGLAILVRALVGLGGYSGEGNPPEYGDFEAQRNWMSIAWNRPTQLWYHQPQQRPWWRLDYPPVAGYLSWVCALFMSVIHPKGLEENRGYQELTFKSFMRLTVLVCDLLTFFVPVLLYHYYWRANRNVARLQAVLILFVPAFILIDHGHFQYNCVMVGLVLAAYLSLIKDYNLLACFLFVVSLFAKQMSLYYALGFFSVLVGKALVKGRVFNDNTYSWRLTPTSIFDSLVQISKYAVLVVAVTLIIWYPWWASTKSWDLTLEVLRAIFPVHRGLYQLKVPNFWCVTDVFFKWQTKLSSETLVVLCGLLTLLASLPSVIAGILVPNRPKNTLFVFINISLAFFFFSYHVHEKTILVPLVFVSLGLHLFGKLALDFVMMSSFIMYHLLKQDGLSLQYFVCSVAFIYFVQPAVDSLHQVSPVSYEQVQYQYESPLIDTANSLIRTFSEAYDKVIRKFVYLLMVSLHVGEALISPPTKFPYLFHLLFSVVGFVFFFNFWILSNVRMITDTISIIKNSQKKKVD